jgi:hypothetical protein
MMSCTVSLVWGRIAMLYGQRHGGAMSCHTATLQTVSGMAPSC